MDIWEQLYEAAAACYAPTAVSPFVEAGHVVAALETASGKIFTGVCMESCSGVMNLCAERAAALNMYLNSGETVVRRLIAFRDAPPKDGSGMPCGACREFLLQLSPENRHTEVLVDYETRTVIPLEELLPHWWGWQRYDE